MNVIDIFQPNNIMILNGVRTKEECLTKISTHACSIGLGNNDQEVLEGFLLRERECTTGFGDGFAIPHTRCDAVKKVGIIVAKSEEGMSWEAMDDQPVTIAIALLVPKENEGNIHIQLLSSLSRKLINKEFKTKLKNAEDVDGIYQIISSALKGE